MCQYFSLQIRLAFHTKTQIVKRRDGKVQAAVVYFKGGDTAAPGPAGLVFGILETESRPRPKTEAQKTEAQTPSPWVRVHD